MKIVSLRFGLGVSMVVMASAVRSMAQPGAGPPVPGVASCSIDSGVPGNPVILECPVSTYCCAAPVYGGAGPTLLAIHYVCCEHDEVCWMQRIDDRLFAYCSDESGGLPPE